MANLDLNNPLDFAKLTLSAGSSLLNQLTGLSDRDWELEEGAYGHPDAQPAQPLVLFHIFQTAADYSAAVDEVRDTAGRRKVPIVFPYVDGQSTDDLGRKAEAFEVNILIHGPKYKAAYNKLLKELNDPRPGTLVHPVRGRVKVAAQDWDTTHSSAQRQAVAMKVSFIEHNFDVTFEPVASAQKNTVKSALTDAISYIGKIAAVINKVESNLTVARNLKASVLATLDTYSAAFSSNLVRLNQTFNPGSASDLPSLLPVNSGTESFPVANSNDPFAAVSADVVSPATTATLAAQQAVDDVKALRADLSAAIAAFKAIPSGELIFYDDILELKRSGISVQETLEVGLRSSRAAIRSYTVPRVMSLREVAFLNGISADRAAEIELLNPFVLSTNHVLKGTVLKVPTE